MTELSRRALLTRLGLAAGAAYVAPGLIGLDAARASGLSVPSGKKPVRGRKRGSDVSKPSRPGHKGKASKPSRPGKPGKASRASRPGRPGKASKPSKPSRPRYHSGPSRASRWI